MDCNRFEQYGDEAWMLWAERRARRRLGLALLAAGISLALLAGMLVLAD
jgi:hypothetical protein